MLLSIHSTAWALSDDPSESFSRGQQAFDNGDYAAALQAFQQAKSLGMDKPSLYYNLGAAYYQTGDYTRARAAFRHLTQHPPMADLGHYNLALVAIKQDDRNEAIRQLNQVLNSTSNDSMRVLANDLLRRLGAPQQPPAKMDAPTTSLLSLSASLGLDDNVTLSAADQPLSSSQASDTFLDLTAFGSVDAYRTSSLSVAIEGNALLLQHRAMNPYDVDYLRGGINLGWQPTDHQRYHLGGYAANTYLGNRPFSRTLSVEGNAHYTMAGRLPLQLHYELNQINSLNNAYYYLEGRQQRARIQTELGAGDFTLQLGFTHEDNDLRDLMTATTFSSYSPLRDTLHARYRFPIGTRYSATLGISSRHSLYRDRNRLADGSLLRRTEQRLNLGATLTHPVSRQTQLVFEYENTSNTSNIPGYTYHRQQLLSGLQITFP
ncbi:MAG: tetratricopeptide repeat protein [Gammaproteobacteria bacterium]|nr:tetratricopeptide repeat protein [Gammaproteobacteria bacterium]